MLIKMDSESGVPLYLQIKNRIKYLVLCGALKSGDQIPAVRELAMQLRINPNTVARAYRELQYEKVILSKWGEGNFISEEINRSRESEKKKLVTETLDRLVDQAVGLGFSKAEINQLITERLKGINGENPMGAK